MTRIITFTYFRFLLEDNFRAENKVYLSENRGTPIIRQIIFFFLKTRTDRENAKICSEDKSKNENEELEGAASRLFDFSASECAFIFNRIAAGYASRQGGNVPPWKIKFYCFLLTDKAREARLGMPSTEIDHH